MKQKHGLYYINWIPDQKWPAFISIGVVHVAPSMRGAYAEITSAFCAPLNMHNRVTPHDALRTSWAWNGTVLSKLFDGWKVHELQICNRKISNWWWLQLEVSSLTDVCFTIAAMPYPGLIKDPSAKNTRSPGVKIPGTSGLWGRLLPHYGAHRAVETRDWHSNCRQNPTKKKPAANFRFSAPLTWMGTQIV